MAKIGAVPLFVDAAAIVLAACAGAPSVQADAATVSNQPFQNQTVERLRCSNQGCRTVTIHRRPGCRRLSLGGVNRGTGYKIVCGQTKGRAAWRKPEPFVSNCGVQPTDDEHCTESGASAHNRDIVYARTRRTHAATARRLPCCHGDRTLTFYSLDGEPPQRLPCLHCEGRGDHPDRRKTARRPRARARSHKL